MAETAAEKKEDAALKGRRYKTKMISMEARGGIEPPIKVLQTFALPLGDRALESRRLTAKQRNLS